MPASVSLACNASTTGSSSGSALITCIENGKIVKSFTFYNEADALEQLGYVFLDLDDLYEE